MSQKQFGERSRIPVDMGAQEFTVAAEAAGKPLHRPDISQHRPDRHFTVGPVGSRSGPCQESAARTVISETSVRLLPPTWPSVEIHTST